MCVDRRTLHGAMKELSRLAGRSPVSDVLLAGHDGKMSVTATDLTAQLTCQLSAEGVDFTACLPAKLLTKLVQPERRGDAGAVTFDVDNNNVAVTADGLLTRFPATNPTLFPSALAEDRPWSLMGMCDAEALREALAWVLPAASTDGTRKHLQSVFIDPDGVMVCSDGYRLHLAPCQIAPEEAILVPSSSASALARMLKEGEQAVVARHAADDHDYLRVRCGAWELTTRLLSEQFTPWRRVVPDREAQETQVIFDTAVLTRALRRVMQLSEQGHVRVCINDDVTLLPSGYPLSDAEMVVPTEENTYTGDGLELELNGRYVADGLPRDGGTVAVSFGKPLNPVRVDVGDGRVAVVMPMRL